MGEEADADWEAGMIEAGRDEAKRYYRDKLGWKDPTCPKCGIVLGNKMYYLCGASYCPAGLN